MQVDRGWVVFTRVNGLLIKYSDRIIVCDNHPLNFEFSKGWYNYIKILTFEGAVIKSEDYGGLTKYIFDPAKFESGIYRISLTSGLKPSGNYGWIIHYATTKWVEIRHSK